MLGSGKLRAEEAVGHIPSVWNPRSSKKWSHSALLLLGEDEQGKPIYVRAEYTAGRLVYEKEEDAAFRCCIRN